MQLEGRSNEHALYTERIAHPIDVDVQDAGDGTAGALVRVNVPDLDPTSLRVLGSTRTAGGRVKARGRYETERTTRGGAIPGLERKVEVRLKVLFNLMNNKKIEAETDSIVLTLPLAAPLVRRLRHRRSRDRRSGATTAGRRSAA